MQWRRGHLFGELGCGYFGRGYLGRPRLAHGGFLNAAIADERFLFHCRLLVSFLDQTVGLLQEKGQNRKPKKRRCKHLRFINLHRRPPIGRFWQEWFAVNN
jgi:hypothetical protein